MKNARSLTTVELIIAICAVFILVGTFSIYANITLKAARELALKNELINLRMSVEHFRIINARLPESLSELLKQRLTIGIDSITIKKNYPVRAFRFDRDGNMLDPFMHRYGYDLETGKIYSQTKDYERW